MTHSSPSRLWIKLISSFTATNILQILVPQESSIRPHHLDFVSNSRELSSIRSQSDWLTERLLAARPSMQANSVAHAYWWYSAMITSYMYHVSFPIISFDMRAEVAKFIHIYIYIWFSSIPIEEDNATEIHSLLMHERAISTATTVCPHDCLQSPHSQ